MQNFERITSIDPPAESKFAPCKMYHLPQPLYPGRNQGELLPWHLRPRITPMPQETPLVIDTIRRIDSTAPAAEWVGWLSGASSGMLILPGGSTHRLEIQAPCHSTAFLQFLFSASSVGSLKITYSEGYESEPIAYPSKRVKGDRLDASGILIGPHDEVDLSALAVTTDQGQGLRGGTKTYEPFWYRTFRHLVLELKVPEGAEVGLVHFEAKQTNYPLGEIGDWQEEDRGSGAGDLKEGGKMREIWEMSVRTLRNCAFDGYSDCPFYEQLQ